MPLRPVVAALFLPLLLAPSVAFSQLAAHASPGVSRGDSPLFSTGGSPLFRQPEARRGQIPLWLSPIFSAILPGSGQLRLGQERFAAYMAVEAYSWIRYARHRTDGKRGRDGYRSLAAEVARSVFSAAPPIGGFDYYESMEQFIESGVFDISEEPDIQPELDETTFNGFLWRRARETFWEDPGVQPPIGSGAYQRSIAFYLEGAVTPEFRWSWRNAQLEHDLYRRTISGSNHAFRRSVTDLGVILGNHVFSMVDAFVTLRLQAGTVGGERGYSITGRIPFQMPTP